MSVGVCALGGAVPGVRGSGAVHSSVGTGLGGGVVLPSVGRQPET